MQWDDRGLSKNLYGLADVLASILFIYKDMNIRDVINKIDSDLKNRVEYGKYTADCDRTKVVFEICERYKFENIPYDDINKHKDELNRPKEEIIPIYDKLVGLYSDLITYKNPKAKYYAISDIHGHLDILNDTVKNIRLGINDKLIFLGDYIDCGPHSRQTLEYLYNLQQRFPDNVVVLRGNHEEWYLEWLENNIEIVMLEEDQGLNMLKTFLTDKQFDMIVNYLKMGKTIFEVNSLVKKYIKKNYPGLIEWMKKMPLYYQTENMNYPSFR